ncbi:hypothetical protein F511_12314 [Dorcoceras hygrometricum]|uniref:Uncharacterized protein n=1 Tax=Dorcoceras hygrometricum TaxID=472368 RepID=A0A2Z7DDV3_9LAMI|nr:hypothetical protein F511_12314 [Dorcoceras hygrometricum]
MCKCAICYACVLILKCICGTVNERIQYTDICFWKFEAQSPTSPLLPPRKVPLEDESPSLVPGFYRLLIGLKIPAADLNQQLIKLNS